MYNFTLFLSFRKKTPFIKLALASGIIVSGGAFIYAANYDETFRELLDKNFPGVKDSLDLTKNKLAAMIGGIPL